MSKLKKVGQKVRRIRKAIALMDPAKVYPLQVGDKVVKMTGKDWKNAARPKE